MADQLVDFLRGRKEHAEQEKIDWAAKKDIWVRSVENLYGIVEDMLRDSITAKDVSVRRVEGQVTEEYIGTYTIPTLELNIGAEHVEFVPKGLTVIGATGRVDVLGARDRVTLLREQQDVESNWSIVLQRVPNLRTAALDRESLRYALERVMLPLA